ncbi:MAG TPA: hypothetical protein VGM56_00125 [Byssovorax sp.]
MINHGDGKLLGETHGTRVALMGTTDATIQTWAQVPLPVEEGPDVFDQWGHWISFAHVPGETHGRLLLSWFTTSGSDSLHANRQVSVAGTTSTDDGATFSAISFIAAGTGVPWLLTDKWGDYNGGAVSPSDGDVLSAWSDTRAGGQTNIWGHGFAP